MDITTGREFPFSNPQDDPHLYPVPPNGFMYNIDGTLTANQVNQYFDKETKTMKPLPKDYYYDDDLKKLLPIPKE